MLNLKDKKSKVALCRKCKGFILASHMDYTDRTTEKDFTRYTNEGFEVKIETLEKTRSRELVFYSENKNGKCRDCNNTQNGNRN
jgi:hypothetical protein